MTIGEYIEAVREKSLLRPATIESYAVALRMIAGEITGRKSKAHRNAIKLRSITDDKIEAWRAAYIKRKAANPLAEKSARITASSLILRAKALFFADTVARIRDVVEVPDPVPFASVKAESVPPPRYRSTFDIIALVESAKEELATERPRAVQDFSPWRDGGLAPPRDRSLAVARVPLRRGRDPHRDDGALPAEVSFERGRHPRRQRASRYLSRLPGAGEE